MKVQFHREGEDLCPVVQVSHGELWRCVSEKLGVIQRWARGKSEFIHIQLITMYELVLAPIGSPGSWDKVSLSILHMYVLPFLQLAFKKVWQTVICLHSA